MKGDTAQAMLAANENKVNAWAIRYKARENKAFMS
jgi:hypothetical protein